MQLKGENYTTNLQMADTKTEVSRIKMLIWRKVQQSGTDIVDN